MSENVEIKELKKCIKEKDRRIKKIENYFRLRNKLILTTIISLLCLSPFILMFLFMKPLPSEYKTPLTLLIFGIIGVATVAVGSVFSWFWSMTKIWEGG